VSGDADDVSSLSEVLYKSLRGTFRSTVRWLLKCSNVSPPPTRASDLVKLLEQTNLTDVVVHPTDHTPFYITMSLFVVASFVVFYVLMVAYTWISQLFSGWKTTLKTSEDPSQLPVMQPDQMGFEERPPKFKVKMSEPVHVHLVESTKKRSEAAGVKRGGSLRGEISARGKVESIVEIPVQTAPPMVLPPGSVEKILDRESVLLASTQSSHSTAAIPASTTASTASEGKREGAGRGDYDCVTDHSTSASENAFLKELARTPTAAERKALSLIFGDSEDESERRNVVRRRKPTAGKPVLRGTPLAQSTPLRRPDGPTSAEVSFREPSEFELSLGVRYAAGAEATATPVATSPTSKKYTPASKQSTPSTPGADSAVGAGSPPDGREQPAIGLLPLSTECATRAGCRECQLQPLQVVLVRWSDANSKTVFVTGSFVNWNSKIPMRRDRVGWVVELRLPRGHHEYRFIVDGKWELDRGRLSTIHTKEKGIVNHVVHVN
ncbi:hypothetical protein PFISCL1PPCAC_16517, partial [Pristionchus fissidentatus]